MEGGKIEEWMDGWMYMDGLRDGERDEWMDGSSRDSWCMEELNPSIWHEMFALYMLQK